LLTARRTAPEATAVALESVNNPDLTRGEGRLINERVFSSQQGDTPVDLLFILIAELLETAVKKFLERDRCGKPAD